MLKTSGAVALIYGTEFFREISRIFYELDEVERIFSSAPARTIDQYEVFGREEQEPELKDSARR